MSQMLEDFAAEQRVRGDSTLAYEVYDLLEMARELKEWEELRWRPGVGYVSRQHTERDLQDLEDVRELLVQGGYLSADVRTTPLAQIIALFMPPL